ncbi:hypothetical protein [Brevundimonas sp.]|uniref:hypothetical protein n=1 Tax=Brevundimonas sp. TaxID=1871086 RepID=UPI00273797E3|nr:hypothetical protein [Brevundimonas sp.]MDP3801035.1 hypothetical protein [Brevundimonas sp.]
MKQISVLAAAIALSACATAPAPVSPQDAFFARLTALCGQRFEGRVVTTDAADADFARSRLLMHVRDCSANEVRIPFRVGENRSRTWVITRTASGLRLKHDHRHEDGTEDELSQYGGDTTDAGTATRQEFPVDQFSKDLFTRRNATVSNTNVWAVEVEPGRIFAYELRRPNRHFRVEFDLTRPVVE